LYGYLEGSKLRVILGSVAEKTLGNLLDSKKRQGQGLRSFLQKNYE